MILVFIIFGRLNCGRTEYGCDCEPVSSAIKTVYVDTINREASYSTYDYTGGYEADAACHADMKLTFRWVDNALAQSGQRPPLSYEFKSVFGYFPVNQDMEEKKLDSETNTYYWTISISEAINKDKPEGSSYGIYVKHNGTGDMGSPIECEIDIAYYEYSEEAYSEGCQ